MKNINQFINLLRLNCESVLKQKKYNCIQCKKEYKFVYILDNYFSDNPIKNGYSDKFCHVKCKFEFNKLKKEAKKKESKIYILNCVFCDTEFESNNEKFKYCSTNCSNEINKINQKKKRLEKSKNHISSSKLNQLIEYSRVKERNESYLKKFNACRG